MIITPALWVIILFVGLCLLILTVLILLAIRSPMGDCKCGHSGGSHNFDIFDGWCAHGGCKCIRYSPKTERISQ